MVLLGMPENGFRTLVMATVILFTSFISQGQSLENSLSSLNGTIATAERQAAADSLREGNTVLFVRAMDNLLWVGVKSIGIGVASLCVANDHTVDILHASAALGSVTYTQARNSSVWSTNQDFSWALRNTSMSVEALRERESYLKTKGWVATTSGMGNPDHMEFLIDQDVLPGRVIYIAVGIMPTATPDSIIGLPSGGAGDCANGTLVRGSVPGNGLQWETGSWIPISTQ